MRTSFVSVPLAALGAQPEAVGEARVVLEVPGEDPKAAVSLIDLSPFARSGFKGADTPAWLEGQGMRIASPNQAVRQDDGALVARLSQGEFLILERPGNEASLLPAWTWDIGLCFPVPRQDTHAWFRLEGEGCVALMATLCAVDLRERVFPDGAVAQTSVARHNAIIVRDSDALHLLVDSASAEGVWRYLVDAGASPLGARRLL